MSSINQQGNVIILEEANWSKIFLQCWDKMDKRCNIFFLLEEHSEIYENLVYLKEKNIYINNNGNDTETKKLNLKFLIKIRIKII